MVKSFFVSVVALMLAGMSVAQTGSSSGAAAANSGAPTPQAVFPAVWHPAEGFLPAAHAACDKAAQPKRSECFLQQMTSAGASPEAVAFARELSHSSVGQTGIMEEYRAFGPLGMAWVVYPEMTTANNNAVLILHGEPKVVDPDDLQKLDRSALQKDPLFVEWKQTAPKLDVFPGDRAAGAAQIKYAKVWPGDKPGDQRFLFTYPLLDGCTTCKGMGFANYWWDFDANGKFLKTQLISVTRGAPPINRRNVIPHRMMAPPANPSSGVTPAPMPAPGMAQTPPQQ